jgi:hypothetical protein
MKTPQITAKEYFLAIVICTLAAALSALFGRYSQALIFLIFSVASYFGRRKISKSMEVKNKLKVPGSI